jgi:TATA-box binding protein (TBP) (component of TFIID and TFIIIB)
VKGAKDVHVDVINVAATCKLPFKVSLESLATMLPERVKLNPRYPKYRCAYVKVEGIRGVVAAFASGTMISVGSGSVEDAERDLTIAHSVILKHIEHLHEFSGV